MKLAFAVMFVCGALFVSADSATPVKAQTGACSYQACFNKCVKAGNNNSTVCNRGCARRCYQN
jgi:hypothetical protein